MESNVWKFKEGDLVETTDDYGDSQVGHNKVMATLSEHSSGSTYAPSLHYHHGYVRHIVVRDGSSLIYFQDIGSKKMKSLDETWLRPMESGEHKYQPRETTTATIDDFIDNQR